MSISKFQPLNKLNEINLEFYDAKNKFWTKAEFLGINGEKEYTIRISKELDEHNVFNTNEENLRVVNLMNIDKEDKTTNKSSFEYSI